MGAIRSVEARHRIASAQWDALLQGSGNRAAFNARDADYRRLSSALGSTGTLDVDPVALAGLLARSRPGPSCSCTSRST